MPDTPEILLSKYNQVTMSDVRFQMAKNIWYQLKIYP